MMTGVGYVVQHWVRVPLLILVEKVFDGAHADNLTIGLLRDLEQKGGLQVDDIVSKLLCFEANGVATFQGDNTGVIQQIASKFAPYCIGVHCMAH